MIINVNLKDLNVHLFGGSTRPDVLHLLFLDLVYLMYIYCFGITYLILI